MPQINLLNPAIGKKIKKTKAAKAVETSKTEVNGIPKILFAPGLTMSIMLCLWLIMGQQVSAKNKILKTLLQKERALSVNPKKLVELNNIKQVLEERLYFVEDLLFRNFFWSDKLEEISKVIPFGVWLKSISLQKRSIELQGSKDESKDKYLVLSIIGRAVAPKIQDAIDLIGRFNVLLKKDESFSKDFFDIELKSVFKGAIAKTDVMSFEFVCTLK